jgi:hypothetical protein
MLHALGFGFVPQDKFGVSDENLYWLGSKNEQRESDATLILDQGRSVRFDLGFIGRGNSEISKDKRTRYERAVEHGRMTWDQIPIIVVDRIPRRSVLREYADAYDGRVVEMSNDCWPKRIAESLHAYAGYESPLLAMPDDQIRAHFAAKLQDAPLEAFLRLGEKEVARQVKSGTSDSES